MICRGLNQKAAVRRAMGWPFLWLALILAAPTPAQPAAPAQEAASPIPTTEIATRAAEVAALLANVDAVSAPSPESLEIERSLPERSKRIQAGWDATIQRLAGEPSAPQLEDMTIAWRGVRVEFRTWADQLAGEGTRLQQELQHLSDLREAWAKSSKEAQSAKAPPEVAREIEGILSTISAAQARVNARLASLLVLQYEVALEIRRCDQVLSRIAQAKSDLVSHLGTQDALPIWSPTLWVGVQREAAAGLQTAGRRWRNELLGVARNQWRGLGLQAVLFMALLVLLVRARGRARSWILPEAGIAAAARMPERPASAALVLTLLATPWIYPSYALAVFRTAKLVGIIPALRLVTPLVSRAQARRLYGFGVVIAADALRPLLATAPDFDHALFLAEMLGASLLLGRILVVERRASPASETDGVTGRHTGRLLIVFILWLAFAFSLLLGAAGYMQLARLIGDGALESTYAALAILIGVWVLLVLFAYALWARPLGLLESVQRNRAFLERRAGQVLRGVGGAAWVLISLRPLTLFSAPAGLVRAALGAGFAWGSIRITVGDVLLFVVTVWVAFALAAIVRAVLQVDVLPRVRLAEGVPLALANLAQYAIVLAGFILGLAALGVDLTKVTILVGAFGVGVGFGLQTLVGNFASGLILLFERPIREGDSVQVGDVQGQVRHIGIRATVVRTGRGANVFVPNAHLLTEKITNWTYTDRTLRIDLPVSVAYDSDPRRVMELLCRVAGSHADVLRDPAPAAVCLGFGASGLAFELRVWTSRSERADAIRSELAEATCAALTEAKIPFPQREVWLRLTGDADQGAWRPPST